MQTSRVFVESVTIGTCHKISAGAYLGGFPGVPETPLKFLTCRLAAGTSVWQHRINGNMV